MVSATRSLIEPHGGRLINVVASPAQAEQIRAGLD